MAQGVVAVEHPNRDTPASQATRALVVGLIVASAAVLVVVTAGGWSKLQGARPVQIAFIAVYLVLAFSIARWRSGMLPVAAALAIVLALFAAISGPEWFARSGDGYTDPALDAGLLGVLTLLLVPLQVLVIVFAARGFAQHWSVEVERGGSSPPAAPRLA